MADDTSHSGNDEYPPYPFQFPTVVSVDEERDHSREDLFALLSDPDAHAVLDYLGNAVEGTTTLQDVATSLNRTVGSGDSPDRVKVRLHHMVLPKLDEAALVDYDPDTNTVQYIGPPLVDAYLGVPDDV